VKNLIFKKRKNLFKAVIFTEQRMFIWKASAILKESAIGCRIYTRVNEINEALGSPQEAVIVPRVYKKLAAISIDYGVMENRTTFMLEGDFGWSDVGSWDALGKYRKKIIKAMS